jgi:inosose dehydratase
VPVAFSERERWEEGFAGMRRTLDAFDASGSTRARPVLCDAGGPERLANPGRGGEDPSLGLGKARWATLVDGVERAAELARERGYEPVFHHHTSTYVEGIPEIERFLADSDVPLLLDSGHVLVAGGDPVVALADWAARIEAVHVKDVRLDVLSEVKAERADTISAWRRGLFCALGEGDVDLVGFCAGLDGYDGWLVVEQDRVLADLNGSFDGAAADQVANRDWLRANAGW